MSPLESTSDELFGPAAHRGVPPGREEPIYAVLLALSAVFLLVGLIFVQFELYSFYRIIFFFKT